MAEALSGAPYIRARGAVVPSSPPATVELGEAGGVGDKAVGDRAVGEPKPEVEEEAGLGEPAKPASAPGVEVATGVPEGAAVVVAVAAARGSGDTDAGTGKSAAFSATNVDEQL